MASQIFVNLPVKDLNRAVEFFTKLGYTFNPQFTDENAVGAKAQRGLEKIANRHRAAAFCIRGPGLKIHDVRALHLKLARVFDNDNSLALRHKCAERVEQRGLAAARSAGHHDIEFADDHGTEGLRAFEGQAFKLQQSIDRERFFGEAANRYDGALGSNRR